MKKRFSEEQIIAFLKEADRGNAAISKVRSNSHLIDHATDLAHIPKVSEIINLRRTHKAGIASQSVQRTRRPK